MLATLLSPENGGALSTSGQAIALSGSDIYIAKIDAGQLYVKKHSGTWSTSASLATATTTPIIGIDENGYVHILAGSKYCRSSAPNSIAAFNDHSADLPIMGAPRFFNYDAGKLGLTFVSAGAHYMSTYSGTWATELILENPGMTARGSHLIESAAGNMRGLFYWSSIQTGEHVSKLTALTSAFAIDIDCNIAVFDYRDIGIDEAGNPYIVAMNSDSGYLVESVPV